jgi:RHS repeat-associated protein
MYPCDIKNAEMDANGQILAQHDYENTPDEYYFYLHDRLGSVRIIIDDEGNVENYYTYDPFGERLEGPGAAAVSNPFEFTGQWFDSEIGQYCLRARMYDPVISRFTSRDPVTGQFENPLSLHKYLYCQNEPIGRIDPWGLLYEVAGAGKHYNLAETQNVMDAFLEHYEKYGFLLGSFWAFYTTVEGRETYIERLFGHPFFGEFDYKGSLYTFTLEPYTDPVEDSEFGNYLAGFAGYYYWGGTGTQIMGMAGEWYSQAEYGESDDLESRRWIARGVLGANLKQKEEGSRGLMGQRNEVLIRSILWNINIMNFERDWDLGGSFYYAW